MAVSSTSSTTSALTTSTTSSTSSNTILDKDAFLKLLLVEMQHQDPTDPMDSDKMLTQTSQLASLEMQQNTNTTMEKMVETMTQLSEAMLSNSNMQYSALSALGKVATISDSTILLTSANDIITAKMYLPKETKDGATFQIVDSSGNVIREIKVEKDDLVQGINEIVWDGKDSSGTYAGYGNYTIKTSYTDIDGGTSTSTYGSYPIEAIKFVDGVAYAQIAGEEVTFDKISQISA